MDLVQELAGPSTPPGARQSAFKWLLCEDQRRGPLCAAPRLLLRREVKARTRRQRARAASGGTCCEISESSTEYCLRNHIFNFETLVNTELKMRILL
ncbi:hypothetical protein EVAR_17122_1 [Eumeta japonica]|uniref:Uncharacterized protein n=1 Tax=Eumeta variegata TaxID=151549 RepID=A0A4C1UML8_EUMVA|nr:hypothetical protein EVAR_17122_1 [Eumeta japonica]